jgi:pyruvate dehydrogenase E2 component (dihydrolipoamide acetyltransferase)
MSVSVSMPQLGESVTEGTVTRWLKHEGDHVSADEPLLEVSTDKVDTEIPSPVSGILRGITVAEDETVAVGAELAIIDEDGSSGAGAGAQQAAPAAAPQDQREQAPYEQPQYEQAPAGQYQPPQYEQAQYEQADHQQGQYEQPQYEQPQYEQPQYEQPQYEQPQYEQGPYAQPATGYEAPPSYQDQGQPPGQGYAGEPASYQVPPPAPEAAPPATAPAPPYQPGYPEPAPAAAYATPPAPAQREPALSEPEPGPSEGVESPYVTPLVRKLAAEHDIDLGSVVGSGVGGRIRKQDVLDAARLRRGGEAPRPAGAPAGALAAQPAVAAQPVVAPQGPPAAQPAAAPSGQAAPAPKTIPAPSNLRGTTERLSRARQVIAQRMVESLQTSAQLTTVVEADVTAIARLRDRIKSAFEAREGVKLSFLPFFALATIEALKAHPKLNAVLDMASGTVTYHDAEHLGIAVDTERGLMVPVIRNAGDLNIGGLARKIADLAQRTRAGQVSPDDLTGGTFTLTNTGSRGALFDTPIINQPQVGILGTGTVSKRAVVVDDPDLGEVITARSVVYLALTYDHRLVDGADAARFLVTIKNRLEEGAFEAEFGR